MKNILLALFIVFLSNLTFGQTNDFVNIRFVETISKVDTMVVPDRLYLSIVISEKDTKGNETLEHLERSMIEALELLRVNVSKQLVVSDLASNFKKYFIKRQMIVKTKSFELLLYDAKSVGMVIKTLDEVGISNIDLIRTEYAEIEALKLRLKSKAILKAKIQAEALVVPLGQKVGSVLYISDTEQQIERVLEGRVSGVSVGYDKMKQEIADVDVSIKKMKVVNRVITKFEIND